MSHSDACRSREQAPAATRDQHVGVNTRQHSVDLRPRLCARVNRRPPGSPSQNVSAGFGLTEEYVRRVYQGLLPDDLGVRLAADRHSRVLHPRFGGHLNGEVRDKRDHRVIGCECHRRVPQFLVSKVRDSGNTSHPFFKCVGRMIDSVRSLRARDSCGNTESCYQYLLNRRHPPPSGRRRSAH